jgi:hypothetical protein
LLLLLMVLLHLLRLLLHHRWNGFWIPWHLGDTAPRKLVLPFLQ